MRFRQDIIDIIVHSPVHKRLIPIIPDCCWWWHCCWWWWCWYRW